MPTFLFAGKDVEGIKRHERVDAENAQDAKANLASRGWTDLQLVIDELGFSKAIKVESVNDDCECADDDSAAEFETPEAQASFYRGGWKTSVLARTLKSIVDSWKLILVSVALIGWGIYRHHWLPIVIGGFCLGFAVLFIPIFHAVARMFGNVRTEFHRMNRAKVWARWNEVLECVELLRKPDRITGSVFPEFELVRSRAQALAGLGRLDEALAEYKKMENSEKVERWLYDLFFGTIYDAAHQYEKALEIRRAIAARRPDSAMIWTDVAYSCVRHLNRPAEGREALARAERLESSEIGKAYLPFVRGMTLWREHQSAEAKKQLQKALEIFQPLARNPLSEGTILGMKSFLCAAHVDLGETATAKALLREVEPYLIAHKEEELLAACRGNHRPVPA
jgi:tetratricopeptide (TPR) repeat protein